jgi:hypothetical protein
MVGEIKDCPRITRNYTNSHKIMSEVFFVWLLSVNSCGFVDRCASRDELLKDSVL